MDREFRKTLADGRPAGSWVSIPSPTVAEVTAGSEFDFVVIDTEHTPTTTETVEAMVRAVEAAPGDTTPVARVAWNDPVRIKRILDTGVAGIIAPQVSTADEARALVDATRYPPTGVRGVAAGRASGYGHRVEEYLGNANEGIATIAQIETPEAVQNTAAITTVKGLDAVLVGPADLSTALDVPLGYEESVFREAVNDVLEAAELPVGTLATSSAEIDRWLEWGFDYLIVGTDTGYLTSGAGEALDRYKTRLDES